MTSIRPQIEGRWKEVLEEEFAAAYFQDLKKFLVEERETQTIYPPGNLIFSAFNHTPFNKVKIVILGQDPYHGPGQAHGLCFSVPEGVQKPPSLLNIFKEIHADLGYPIPESGNLEKWAHQGVLLLNATLTVRANQAGSHQKRGWEEFTDSVIKKLSDYRENLIFLLWGKYAGDKDRIIDSEKHNILKAPHPSPLSANRGFFGCKHFSTANQILRDLGLKEIDWQIE
jgi:uracil-DNA glycosylase